MNLRALQFADINASLTALIDNDRFRSYSIRLQSDDDSIVPQHVLLEKTECDCPHRTEQSQAHKKNIFKSRPVFTDSLLSTEILFTLPCSTRKFSSKSEEYTSHEYPLSALDFPATNNLQYRLHDPLPEYLSAHLYRAGLHTVVIIDNEQARNVLNVSLACKAHRKLHGTLQKTISSQQAVIPCFIDSNHTRGIHSKHKRLESLHLEPYRLTHTCHRLNVISKADLVLCDSSGTAVDAIRSGVPAVFLADIPVGFENIQYAVELFLRHGNSEQLLAEQQQALNAMLHSHCRHHYVMSNHSTLEALVQEHLTTVDSTTKKLDECEENLIDPICDDLILCTQQTLRGNQSTTTRLKTGVERSRRKFQKFRESPSRFMRESQIRVLRSLVANRSQ